MSIGRQMFIGIYGIMSCAFLTFFCYWAVIFGGSEGKVVLYFNMHNEMIFELFLLNGLLILMIGMFISLIWREIKVRKSNLHVESL